MNDIHDHSNNGEHLHMSSLAQFPKMARLATYMVYRMHQRNSRL